MTRLAIVAGIVLALTSDPMPALWEQIKANADELK